MTKGMWSRPMAFKTWNLNYFNLGLTRLRKLICGTRPPKLASASEGGEYRSRTGDLPESSSGRSSTLIC